LEGEKEEEEQQLQQQKEEDEGREGRREGRKTETEDSEAWKIEIVRDKRIMYK
jgi:hypothetical protein